MIARETETEETEKKLEVREGRVSDRPTATETQIERRKKRNRSKNWKMEKPERDKDEPMEIYS